MSGSRRVLTMARSVLTLSAFLVLSLYGIIKLFEDLV